MRSWNEVNWKGPSSKYTEFDLEVNRETTTSTVNNHFLRRKALSHVSAPMAIGRSKLCCIKASRVDTAKTKMRNLHIAWLQNGWNTQVLLSVCLEVWLRQSDRFGEGCGQLWRVWRRWLVLRQTGVQMEGNVQVLRLLQTVRTRQ